MNSVVLIGRLTRDPELRFIPGSGMAVANFSMAVNKDLSKEKKQEFESSGKPTVDFIRIQVWGKQAENCSQYLAKGRLVGIQGSIQTSSYKNTEGVTVYTTEVLANKVEFLEFGDKADQPKKDTSGINDDFSFGSVDDKDDVPWL
ncbi:MAG TPA: single-stranded DNA-binding protein [Fusibacter sp.]|nr:single-stranded DNA-binding protein [Fusibacter sp.]